MVRLALAALLALQPVVQAAEHAPVDYLLTNVIPQDEAALATSGPEKGERLAKLQADLALVFEALEGFASEEDAMPSLKRLRESVDAPVDFKNRAAALDAVYRALAVVDYTWAKRLREAACAPEASRARLLKSGPLTSWIASLLGPAAEGSDAAAKLDQASAAAPASAREYALLRAKVRKMTAALASEKAIGSVRALLYCRRAAAYEALSSANRSSSRLVAASRASVADDDGGVYVLARKTSDGLELLGAATSVGGALLTDGRLADGEGLVVLGRGAKTLIPVRVERRDGSGLALLRAEEPLKGFILAEKAPAKDELIEAIGHPERTGAWTRTRGLVTAADSQSFQTDAVIDVGMSGGAALTEDGRLAGVFVLRSARQGGQTFDWPVAVAAPALRGWLDGRQLTVPSVAVDIEESGTASIQTASRPLLASLAPGAQATQAGYSFYDGNVRAVCKANCGDSRPSSGSSYGSNGGAELGQALGQALVPVVEALIFRGIPALFRGIGSLFTSKPKPVPKSSPARSEPRSQPKVVEAPKPTPELTVTLAPSRVMDGKEAVFILTVKSNRNDFKTSGLNIDFTVEYDKETSTGTAVTDAAGIAILEVRPSPAGRSFVDLQRESDRHPDLIVAGRETNGEKICKIVLPGSLALGMLAVTALAVRTPVGWAIIYVRGPDCLARATGLMAGAGAFCAIEFGKQAMVPSPRPVAPGYSSPVKVPVASKKPQDAFDSVRNRAERAVGELDGDAGRGPDAVPAPSDDRSMAGGQSADPNEPPEDNDPEDAEREVNLSQDRLDHIVERHWPGSDSPGAGKFIEGTRGRDLLRMVRETAKHGKISPNTHGRPGKIFEYMFKNPIGRRSNGTLTNSLRLVVGPDGSVITAFPF